MIINTTTIKESFQSFNTVFNKALVSPRGDGGSQRNQG